MDEKIKAIQERLRGEFGQHFGLNWKESEIPVVSFEEIAGTGDSAKKVIEAVATELLKRGYRPNVIRRLGASAKTSSLLDSVSEIGVESVKTVTVFPDRVVTIGQPAQPPTYQDLIRLADPDADIILGESFGYSPLPKILVTEKPQEGFNLGLPNVIAYVSTKDLDAMIPYFAPDDIHGIVGLIVDDVLES